MALDFPSNPTPGTVYLAPNDILYVFDGTKWVGSSLQTDIIPAEDVQYDIGEELARWRKIFTSNLEVSSTITSGHILPSQNITYDLGSTSSQWRSLYVGTSTIYIGGTALSVSGGNITVDGSPVGGGGASLGQFKISGNNLGTVDNPDTGGWGGYDMYIDPGNGSDAFIYIPGVPNQAASTNLQISNNSTAGAIQLFGRGGVQVVVNHGVNEKVFEFADNGSLIFPNSTIQSSAWTGSTSTLVNGTYTVQLLIDGNLTLPGEVHGKQLYGFGGTPNGRAVNITPASNASDKQFKFRVDQYGETFTRAYLDMPTAQNNKQVAISFAHENNTVGYIFNQGADTFDDGLNNAFNIFYNAGDIKLTAMTTGTGVFKTWKFGQSGNLSVPGPIVATTSSGLTLAANYSAQIITDYGDNNRTWTFDGTGGDTTFPNGTIISDDGSGNTQLRVPAITTGTYKEFTFHNDGRLQLGNTIGYIYTNAPMGQVIIADYLGPDGSPSAPSTVLTLGGIDVFKISSGPPAVNWTFKDNGSVVFPDGTTSTGASVYVPYATSSSFIITTEIDMMGGYLPSTFEVKGDRIKLPSGNGLIQSGEFSDPWWLDSNNKSFTFPNLSDIDYGDGTFLSTGTLQVRIDFGGEFKIFLSESNKTWTFNNSGNIVFPDGTTQTTAYVGGSPLSNPYSGLFTITNITTASSTSSAALTVVGGIGVGQNIYVGTQIVFPDASVQTSAYTGGFANERVTNVFMYNSNSSFSMTQNQLYVIPFDTATTGHDAGDFTLGTYTFNPTIAGWYNINIRLSFSGVWSGNVTMYTYKNGSEDKQIGSSWIGNGGSVSASVLCYLNGSTDTLQIRGLQASGGVQSLESGANKTWFQAVWVKA